MLPLKSEQQLALALQDPTIGDLACRRTIADLRRRVDSFASFLDRTGCKVCFFGTPAYPKNLGTEEHPPFRLCYRGRLPGTDEPLVSVCGTRYPDTEAAKESFAFALEAGANGVGVVTSHSRGIDRAALRGLGAAGGAGFVCCDCGLGTDRIARNRTLDGMNLISPYEPYDRATRWRCIARNMLTVSLSPALVVFQAPVKSGALLCCREALDAGREVFVHRIGLREGTVNEGTRNLETEGCLPVSGWGEVARHLGEPAAVRIRPGSAGTGRLYRFGDSWYSLIHGTE
jgi:DNA processing protein